MGIGVFRRAAGLGVLTACCAWPGLAEKPATVVEPQPAVRIAVEPLGFLAPSSFYLTYRLSSASLSFIDDDHLLFTFHHMGLLRRVPGDDDNDDDQEIEAVVLNLRTGKVQKQADWRMHDRGQYLWGLGRGEFLVRQRNVLFRTDGSLELKPYLSFDAPLESVQISPDRKWLVFETDDAEAARKKAASAGGAGKGRPVKVMLVAAGMAAAQVESRSDTTITVPMLGDGVVNTLEGGSPTAWVLREVPLHGEAHTLLEVKSECQPRVQTVSATVALAMGCFSGSERPVIAVSDTGEVLWRQFWQTKYVWPWFDAAANGSRFAYESIEVAHSMTTFEPLYPEDVVAQWAGVYDTETGKLVMVENVSPVMSAGQNVALSDDGTRFAVLRAGEIEVFDLPPVEARTPEVAKKADVRKKK